MLAIIGVLSALAVSGVGRTLPRIALMNAGDELVSDVAEARSRALATQGYTWLVVQLGQGASAPPDGYFAIDDPDADLQLNGFHNSLSTAVTPLAGDRVMFSRWFDQPPYTGRVGFAVSPGMALSGGTFQAAAGAASQCSFCSPFNGGRRGVVRFGPDGEATFFKADGTRNDAAQGFISVGSADGARNTTIGIAAQTGMLRVFKK